MEITGSRDGLLVRLRLGRLRLALRAVSAVDARLLQGRHLGPAGVAGVQRALLFEGFLHLNELEWATK